MQHDDVAARNDAVIAEFRANAGRLGGPFAALQVLLLHTVDPLTERELITPLTCWPHARGWVIFASKSGADTHPYWYLTLPGDAPVRIEIGTGDVWATARTVTGAERDEIWTLQKQREPRFVEYERQTTRVIPVILLEPVAGD